MENTQYEKQLNQWDARENIANKITYEYVQHEINMAEVKTRYCTEKSIELLRHNEIMYKLQAQLDKL